MATNAGDEAATGRVVTRYRTLLAAGKITEEPAQLALAKRLDVLDQALSDAPPPSRGKPLGWLFGGRGGADSPVKGLYQCGASTHPGGAVSAVPGHNAAREILSDMRWGRG